LALIEKQFCLKLLSRGVLFLHFDVGFDVLDDCCSHNNKKLNDSHHTDHVEEDHVGLDRRFAQIDTRVQNKIHKDSDVAQRKRNVVHYQEPVEELVRKLEVPGGTLLPWNKNKPDCTER